MKTIRRTRLLLIIWTLLLLPLISAVTTTSIAGLVLFIVAFTRGSEDAYLLYALWWLFSFGFVLGAIGGARILRQQWPRQGKADGITKPS